MRKNEQNVILTKSLEALGNRPEIIRFVKKFCNFSIHYRKLHKSQNKDAFFH